MILTFAKLIQTDTTKNHEQTTTHHPQTKTITTHHPKREVTNLQQKSQHEPLKWMMTNWTSARWAHKSQIQEPVEALNQTAKPQLNNTPNKQKKNKTPPILTESVFFYNSMNSGYKPILANKRIWIWVSLLLFKRWTYRQ